MSSSVVQDVGFRSIDASTGESFGPTWPISGPPDVARVCAAADEAFDAFRETTVTARSAFLDEVGKQIDALGDELVDLATRESGLPRQRLIGERARTVTQLQMFAEVTRRGEWMGLRHDPALPDRKPLPRSDVRLRRVPLGPVAVFGASNFPLAFSTAGGDTASALAAGCPVVVKGHPAHPGTDSMVAGAIGAAAKICGMPDGVFGHLMGPGNELGATLVRDPRIAAVGFTGSRSGGLALLSLAQARDVPIPVFAEMSSINPVLLLPNALAQGGAELGTAFVSSLTLGAGQFCTNPGLVLAIDSPGLDLFISSAATAVANSNAQTMLTGDICRAFEAGVAGLRGHSVVRMLAEGKPPAGFAQGKAAFFACEAQDFLEHRALAAEIFGAVSLLVRAKDEQELVLVLKSLEGQLTATLQMAPEDGALVAKLMPLLERKAGRIIANGWPTGVEVTHAMVHGGPYPATSDSRSTSVGSLAIDRFLRPVAYQNVPDGLLPSPLRDNALGSSPYCADGARR